VIYAGYVRISSEEQVGNFSLDAQKRAIKTWVRGQKGTLVKLYVDEAQSGRDDDRPAFQAMRRDARKGRFDALVVHKFDRLARNRANALAIKSLLRHDYGIKVFSVTEPSEDSDGPMGALIEGIMESVADWYSRNLATEIAKGKLERAHQGLHNNGPPFGYDKTAKGVLIINPEEAEGVKLAFEKHVTGQYSDTQIAHLLNEKGYRSKTGRRFSKDTVRDVLRNKTYLGYVKYQAYGRNSDGSRSFKAPEQWFKGRHEPLVDRETFERSQQARARLSKRKRQATTQRYPYPLSGLIYCGECGRKLRAQSDRKVRRYRCRARELGHECGQTSIRADDAEAQVVAALMQLETPKDWRDRMIQAIGELIGDRKLEQRLEEIHAAIERMDFRWDHGFVTDKDAYVEKRLALQVELEQLTPIPDEDLDYAAEVLDHFEERWEAAEDDSEAQEFLLKLLLVRVWAKDGQIVSLCLRPDFHITAGLDTKRPTALVVDLEDDCYRSGSDGGRTLTGYTIRFSFGLHVSVSITS